jgi:hypothetical protein
MRFFKVGCLAIGPAAPAGFEPKGGFYKVLVEISWSAGVDAFSD